LSIDFVEKINNDLNMSILRAWLIDLLWGDWFRAKIRGRLEMLEVGSVKSGKVRNLFFKKNRL
jgi:hypothetical protein